MRKKDESLAVVRLGWSEYLLPAESAYEVHRHMSKGVLLKHEYFGGKDHKWTGEPAEVIIMSMPRVFLNTRDATEKEVNEYIQYLRDTANVLGDKYEVVPFEAWKELKDV